MYVIGFLAIAIGGALYFLPAIIAGARGMKNALSVFLLNLFFGWTGIGWVGALCWACAGTAEIRPEPVPGQPWPR